jgi:hypothetical protein
MMQKASYHVILPDGKMYFPHKPWRKDTRDSSMLNLTAMMEECVVGL